MNNLRNPLNYIEKDKKAQNKMAVYLSINIIQTYWVIYYLIEMVASNNGMEKNEENEYYQKFMLLTIILSFTTTLVFKIKQLDFEICCSSLSFGFFGTICIIGYFVFIKGDYQNYFEYQFKEAENCKINNIELANFDDHEIFAAISVQIEIKNQQYLTYACASNNLNSDSMWGKELKYSPVKFYGQAMPCGLHHKVLEVDSDIIQNQYYKNLLEIQDIEYGKGHGHRQLQYVDNNYVKQCEFAQEFTKIKLASWMCIDLDYFIDYINSSNNQIVAPKCYYSVYGDQNKAYENAQQQKNIRLENDFIFTKFEKLKHYHQLEFIIIVLVYILGFSQLNIPISLIVYYSLEYSYKKAKQIIVSFQNSNRNNRQYQQNNDIEFENMYQEQQQE